MSTIRKIGIAAFICTVPPAVSVAAPQDELRAACGMISSLSAPTDIHAVAAVFGFRLYPVTTYPPYNPPRDIVLGVDRKGENAPGLMLVLSSAYLAKKNIMVIYRDRDLYALCLQTEESDCPPRPFDKPRCIGSN